MLIIMKKIFITLSSIFLLASCANEESTFNLPVENNSVTGNVISFADYYDFITANTHDKALVSNISYINSTGALNSLSASRANSTNPYILKLNGNTFTPSYIYNSPTGSTYQLDDSSLTNFFGKQLKIDFTTTDLVLTDNTNFDVYVPDLLTVSVSNLINGQLQPGTIITWNADSQNTNGVVLSAEYNPLTQPSEDISTAYPNRISGGLTFEDSGSYTIQEEDLENFPKGSNLTFSIGRAGFIITNNGDITEDLSFGAYTMVKGEYEINY